MLTEASETGFPPTSGFQSAASAILGKDGNNISPNTNIKAQQLTVPANPSHDIRLSLF